MATSAPSGGRTFILTPSITTPFQTALQTQTHKPTPRAVASSLPDALTNASEARYWAEKYGLGVNAAARHVGPTPTHAHPRKLTLHGGSSAVIHQLVFDPSASSCATLAVICGPRVQLYGTTPQSSFHQKLQRSQKNKTSQDDDGNNQLSDDSEQEDNDDNDDFQDSDEGSQSRSHPFSQTVKDQFKQEREDRFSVDADRQLSTGGRLAVSAAFRSDGRLLAIGTDAGQVRVADLASRATLCSFSLGPTMALPIRAVAWFRDGQHVLAAGDDGVLRVWELAQAATSVGAKVTCRGHGDIIRAALLWQDPVVETKWPCRSLAITGSYDHTVRIWNMDHLNANEKQINDESRCLGILDHGGPVEALLLMPSSNPDVPFWVLSAGGTTVKAWNPITGTCVSTVSANHRKTVTCLVSMPRDNVEDNTFLPRVLTGALDGFIRVHSWDAKTASLHLVNGIHLDAAITTMAACLPDHRLVIGTATGLVFVRQRSPIVNETKRKHDPRPGTYSFFMRGYNADAVAGDFIVTSGGGRQRKIQRYDYALRKFRYGDALDEALESRNPNAVVAVLEELGKRRGLITALSNRDEETLEPILSFTVRYISKPRVATTLIGVANMLIDIYGNISGQSETIDELFDKLKKQVTEEARIQRKLLRMVGQLDVIMTMAATAL